MKTLIYVSAPNDVNDNPRRGWIVTWMDNLFVDEGFDGREDLHDRLVDEGYEITCEEDRREFYSSVNEILLDVPTSQYNRLKRGAK